MKTGEHTLHNIFGANIGIRKVINSILVAMGCIWLKHLIPSRYPQMYRQNECIVLIAVDWLSPQFLFYIILLIRRDVEVFRMFK